MRMYILYLLRTWYCHAAITKGLSFFDRKPELRLGRHGCRGRPACRKKPCWIWIWIRIWIGMDTLQISDSWCRPKTPQAAMSSLTARQLSLYQGFGDDRNYSMSVIFISSSSRLHLSNYLSILRGLQHRRPILNTTILFFYLESR